MFSPLRIRSTAKTIYFKFNFMRKTLIILTTYIFASGLLLPNFANADSMASKLKGKILLQVESNGEAWYVNPDNEKRYYLGRPADAFEIMRDLGLGISNKDFDLFNGYASSKLSGKILLKVEDYGKAYYVNPVDLKMHYLGRPADAFQIMRELGLGITNDNIKLIDAYLKNTVLNIYYPQNWYNLNSFVDCGKIDDIEINTEIAENFKNSLSSEISINFKIGSWYLGNVCLDENNKFLPYFVNYPEDKRENLYIGLFDINSKNHKYFDKSYTLSSLGIYGCKLLGMYNDENIAYSCGKGDGPGWTSSLYSLNIETGVNTVIETCTSFNGLVDCE